MKKTITYTLILATAFFLVSWGFKGHQAVATIAENHLTPASQSTNQGAARHTIPRCQ